MVRYDAWAQGARFDLPVFLFLRKERCAHSCCTGAGLVRLHPGARKQMELIADAGHLEMFLQPELVLDKLLAYVRPLAYSRIKALPEYGEEAYHEIL